MGKERNCQIRMPASLWNLVGGIAQELGYHDNRGGHSAVIREMIAASAAKWSHSPYTCRSAHHTIFVTKEGNIFSRQIEVLKVNTPREKLPCIVEMKPEKRDYYHRRYQHQTNERNKNKRGHLDELKWFQNQWIINHFAVWNGKKDADDLDSFSQSPLCSHVDTFGPTYKSADLAVHSLGGRSLTREIIVGLRDYVQWKEHRVTSPSIFDRIDIPIDVPTVNLEVCAVVDIDLFAGSSITDDQIGNLSLEFRNRESARFDGKEVALYHEISFEEQYGRSPSDDGADEALLKIRRLWQRVSALLSTKTTEGTHVESHANSTEIGSSLKLPEHFLFYWLRWPSPHLGIEACVRWEKPTRPGQVGGPRKQDS